MTTLKLAAATTTDYDIGSITVAGVSNYDFPIISSFSHTDFWSEFCRKNVAKNQKDLLELILDISRANFGPKVDNWPGVEIDIKGDVSGSEVETKFSFSKGKSKVSGFNRGKGSTYTWTSACLATAGLFHEIHHLGTEGSTACQQIFGHSSGYTQYCGTLKNWGQDKQDAAEASFKAALTAAGCKERSAEITNKAKSAAATTITKRTNSNCALSLKNVLRICSGVAVVDSENPSL